MIEQKQYRDDLLEWCHLAELNWERLKPRFSKLFDLESLKEWEETCSQLIAKLQEETGVDLEDYKTAISLHEQFEQLNREANGYQEEPVFEVEDRLEMEAQNQKEAEGVETVIFQEDSELESVSNLDSEQRNQYRVDLLEWCNILYSNWNRMKPRISNHVDPESIEEWESLCHQLKEKLEEDQTVNQDDYEIAKSLFEQWERFKEEVYPHQEELQF